VVGVRSHEAGWDSGPLQPSPAPCELCRWWELTQQFSGLFLQDVGWTETVVEGKETVLACLSSLQKSANSYKKVRSPSLLFICATFGFECTCSQREKLLQ